METNNGGDSSPEKNNNTHEMESSADRHGSNSDSSQPQNDDVISSQESNDGGRQSNSPAPLAFPTFSSAAYSPTYSISSTENEEEPNVPSKKGDTEADVIVIDSDESTEDLMVCMGNNDEPENAHSILDTSEDFEFNASDELPVDELPFASQPNKSQICLNSQKVSSSSDTSYSSIGRLLQSIRDSKTGSNLPDDGQVRRNVGFSSDAIENSLVVINEDENSGGSWHSSLRLSMSSQQAAAGSQQPNFWGFPDSDGTVSSTQNIESQGQDEDAEISCNEYVQNEESQ